VVSQITKEEETMAQKPAGMHPGLSLAIVLLVLYAFSFVVFLGFLPQAQIAGIPLFTWSLIAVSVLSVVFGVVFIYRMENWEGRK
jgi:hypothetical protein